MRKLSSVKKQQGFLLIEVLISIVIIGIVSASILLGIATSTKALIITDQRETAKNIAEMQLEYIKSQPYASYYTPKYGYDLKEINTSGDYVYLYPGYTIGVNDDEVIEAQSIDDRTDGNIQKIVVTVLCHDKEILSVAGYKVK